MTIEDRQSLGNFVRDLQRTLNGFVEFPEGFVVQLAGESALYPNLLGELTDLAQSPIRFVPELRPLLQESLREVAPSFEALTEGLRPDSPDLELDSALEAVGLYGVQLRLKLTGYFIYQSLPAPPDPRALSRTSQQPIETRRRKQLGRWLEKVVNRLRRSLSFANTILGSLAAAGLAGADPIKELKECIEHSFPAEV